MTRSAPAEESAPVLVLVFAKLPIPGRCKTRLAVRFGERHAAELARAFLHDTLDRVCDWGRAPVVLLGDRPDPAPFAEFLRPRKGGRAGHSDVEYQAQGDGDLGNRQRRAFRWALGRGALGRGAAGAIALGADTPAYPLETLAQACAEVAAGRVTLSPSTDGGYSLLGLPAAERCPLDLDELFRGYDWGGPSVCATLRARLDAAGVRYRELASYDDFDHPEDLDRWWSSGERERDPSEPPVRTRRLLGTLLRDSGS